MDPCNGNVGLIFGFISVLRMSILDQSHVPQHLYSTVCCAVPVPMSIYTKNPTRKYMQNTKEHKLWYNDIIIKLNKQILDDPWLHECSLQAFFSSGLKWPHSWYILSSVCKDRILIPRAEKNAPPKEDLQKGSLKFPIDASWLNEAETLSGSTSGSWLFRPLWMSLVLADLMKRALVLISKWECDLDNWAQLNLPPPKSMD